ncbi:MAG: integrase [Gammaproteobacteria bacterium]|nr:integrase [Gammaproteobacteria bacterium]
MLSILKHNRDGSCSTRATRRNRLIQIANQLIDDGYQLRHARQLKSKHIRHLAQRWQTEGLSASTIKNRLTDLRWLAEKLGKQGLVPERNQSLAIPNRQHVTHQDKSIQLSSAQLAKLQDPYVKMSLQLQQVFGLRREESIKIQIHREVVGDQLQLQGSWCKNGRPRTIPITTVQQKTVIAQCQQLVGPMQQALIPPYRSYYQHLKYYENSLRQAGIRHAHGLRHAYAQQLYQTLTGWACPVKGGPSRSELTAEQKIIDQAAREQISVHLGHNRLSITAVYCGK